MTPPRSPTPTARPQSRLLVGSLLLCLLTLASTLSQADIQTGQDALNRGDYATAMREFQAAAKEGNAYAQVFIGTMYYQGEGVPQDYAQAAAWIRKAAEQGLAGAQYNLGQLYRLGQGVPQDYAQAASLYRKAAEQGYALAQTHLGLMYDDGKGVPQDYILAYMWYNLAAAKGNKEAIKNRDLLGQALTPSQIAEGQRLTREWLAAHPQAQGNGQ